MLDHDFKRPLPRGFEERLDFLLERITIPFFFLCLGFFMGVVCCAIRGAA